jgi:alanine-glyoxylate transaminase/serine-glyoxylate transaminase/serine-pyruvate transaminase
LDHRKSKVQSWYLDLSMIRNYWGSERVYHHTAPINMAYALQTALQLVVDEGLETRWKRHLDNHKILKAGLEAIDLNYITQEGFQLPMLNAVAVPDGIDDLQIRRQLLSEFNIEIGGGLGAFKGKAIRIGLMGFASSRSNVLLVLAGLEKCLSDQAYTLQPGAATAAALKMAQTLDNQP